MEKQDIIKDYAGLAPHASRMAGRSGFTLIELIIVIAIIAIIAAAVFVAIDPAKRLHASRNARRASDTVAILQAIKIYQADNGSLPSSIDTASGSVQIVGESVGTCSGITCTGQTVISSGCEISNFDTVLRAYMKKPPKDPSTGTDNNTRYYVNQDAYGIVSVGACDAEGEGAGGGGTPPTIEVTN